MDRETLIKWIWLSELLGPAALSPAEALGVYGTVDEAYEMALQGQYWSARVAQAPAKAPPELPQRAARIAEACEGAGVTVVPYDSAFYPPLLLGLSNAPAVLYVTGRPESLTLRCISGVGTRRITPYGKRVTGELLRPVARRGICLVSGLAHGIDAEVHKAALAEDGVTVAVIGCPIHETYPAAHSELRRLIEQRGATVSEYPPLPMAYNRAVFPRRNRIIAGMSELLAVFECTMRSGTMRTVDWALEFGRDIFAVPGRLTDDTSEGCNRIIQSGASPLLSAADLLERLGFEGEEPEKKKAARPPLTGDGRAIWDRLGLDPASEEELSTELGIPEPDLLPLLTELELGGYITRRGGLYQRA